MEPNQAEIAAKALVKPEATAPAAPTSADKMAAKAHTTLTEKGFREALRVEKEPTVNPSGVTSLVEQFGTERDPATGERIRTTTPDINRHDEAARMQTVLNKFLEKGWEGTGAGALSATERSTLMAWGRAEIMRSPALAKELDAMPGAKQKEFIERYMKRPETQAKLREALAQIPENFKLDNAVDVAADVVAQREIDVQTHADEIADIDRRIAEIEKSQARFERDATGAPTATATEAQRIDGLKVSLSNIQGEVARITADRDSAATDVRTLKEQLRVARAAAAGRGAAPTLVTPGGATTTPRSIPDIERDLTAATTSLQTEEAALAAKLKEVEGIGNSIKSIEAEQKALEAERSGLAKDRRVAEAERGKAEVELRGARREYEDARRIRTAQEQNIVNALREAFPNAIREVVNGDIDQLATIIEKQLEEAKASAKTSAEKALLDALGRTLTKKQTKERAWNQYRKESSRPVINKDATNRTFTTLMIDGPNAVIEQMLTASINPETGVNYTPDEIKALMKDPELAKAMQRDAAKQVLSRKLAIGGLAKEDIFVITNSDWGNGLIDDAIKNNEAFKKHIEDVYGQGALDNPGLVKRVLREGKNRTLLSIFLLGVVGVVASAVSEGRIHG